MTAVPWWASDDPWALTPTEQEALDAQRRERAENPPPDEPPF